MSDTRTAWKERVAIAAELECRVAAAKEVCRLDPSAYFAGKLAALDEVWRWIAMRDQSLGGDAEFARKEAGDEHRD